MSRRAVFVAWIVGCLTAASLAPAALAAQDAPVRDLVVFEGDVPVRLVGYGLVVGLDGSGDKVIGGFSSGQTVRSVANLLRRFDIEVPEEMLRTRNVAAVLVTAEASPYLRPGGRFDVHVASVGDATSLRGGVLWSTPLMSGPSEPPVATAQGPVAVSESGAGFGGTAYSVETAAALPGGGVLEQLLPAPGAVQTHALYLKRPDASTAVRIAAAINEAMGEGRAAVLDPGAVALDLAAEDAASPAAALARIGDLRVRPARSALVLIDGRSGTVVAGGDVRVGEAVVSHGSMTLAIGDAAGGAEAPGALRMESGVTVQDVAAALHGVAAPPETIAAVFRSLKDVGALTAEVSVR